MESTPWLLVSNLLSSVVLALVTGVLNAVRSTRNDVKELRKEMVDYMVTREKDRGLAAVQERRIRDLEERARDPRRFT